MPAQNASREASRILRLYGKIESAPEPNIPLPHFFTAPPTIIEQTVGGELEYKLFYFCQHHTSPEMQEIVHKQFASKLFDKKMKETRLVDFNVSANAATNQLIARCPSRTDAEAILEFLMLADIPPIQVKIDCLISEVYADKTVDWETSLEIQDLMGESIWAGPAGKVFGAGVTPLVQETSIAAFPGGSLRELARAKMGLKVGYLSRSHKFMAVVDTLESQGYLKILMNPTIEVVNGKTAKVLSSQMVPLTKTYLRSGNSDLFEARQDYQDVVDSLEITPHVYADGYIGLETSILLGSKLTPEGIKQVPIITKKQITNKETRIRPGESLIIGGLRKSEKRDVVRGIPGLKDIPLLGILFSGRDFEERAVETIFILTPSISTGGKPREEMVDDVKRRHGRPTASEEKAMAEEGVGLDPFGFKGRTKERKFQLKEAEEMRQQALAEKAEARDALREAQTLIAKAEAEVLLAEVRSDRAVTEAKAMKEEAEKAKVDSEAKAKAAVDAKAVADKATVEAAKTKADSDAKAKEAAKAMANAEKIANDATKSKEEAEQAKAEADAKAKEAELAKAQADTKAKAAEQAKAQADATTKAAEQAKAGADAKAEAAEAVMAEAEAKTFEAEQAVADADARSETAALAIEEADSRSRAADQAIIDAEERAREAEEALSEAEEKAASKAEESKPADEETQTNGDSEKTEAKQAEEDTDTPTADTDTAPADTEKGEPEEDKGSAKSPDSDGNSNGGSHKPTAAPQAEDDSVKLIAQDQEPAFEQKEPIAKNQDGSGNGNGNGDSRKPPVEAESEENPGKLTVKTQEPAAEETKAIARKADGNGNGNGDSRKPMVEAESEENPGKLTVKTQEPAAEQTKAIARKADGNGNGASRKPKARKARNSAEKANAKTAGADGAKPKAVSEEAQGETGKPKAEKELTPELLIIVFSALTL